ncbi:MAG: hypothetical protein M1814_001403 [Vezdaea aestivalis]|nr:MAG: hypothetical protein M1814_001403 [Vezdaea aestivalis]
MDHHPLTSDFDVRTVAIIGAGPAGIAAAKYLSAESHFTSIVIYEQSSSFGGAWRYTAQTKSGLEAIPPATPHSPLQPPLWLEPDRPLFISPMYDELETNIPKSLMGFSDRPFPDHYQLFPKHGQVCDYLLEYSKEVERLVKFNCQVCGVSKHGSGWILSLKSTKTQASFSQSVEKASFDAVIVSSGHYDVPNVPDIPGAKEWNEMYPNSLQHSKYFRRGEDYKGKKVIVVGNFASAVDIASQISHHALSPTLQSTRSESYLSAAALPNPLVEQHPQITSLDAPSRTVTFASGHSVSNIDTILFCTGYFYSYPFLSTLTPPIIASGLRTQGLYDQVLNRHHPTLAFLLQAQRVIPFPTAEAQSAFLARLWSNRLPLPSVRVMRDWEEARIADRGDGRDFHNMRFLEDVDYINHLYDVVMSGQAPEKGKRPPKWGAKERWIRERFSALRRAFLERGERRNEVRTMEEVGFDYEAWVEEESGRAEREGKMERGEANGAVGSLTNGTSLTINGIEAMAVEAGRDSNAEQC